MRKRWIVLIVGMSVAAGFVAGAYAGVRFWQGFEEAALETRLSVDSKMRLAALSSLRNGHEDKAILLLENLLDGDVIGLGAILETSSRKPELMWTLSQVAKYRAGTSYRSTNEEVASTVQRTLERAAQPSPAFENGPPSAAAQRER
jgi:hypothetical protein